LHHYNYIFLLQNYDVEDITSFPQILTKLVEFTLKKHKFPKQFIKKLKKSVGKKI